MTVSARPYNIHDEILCPIFYVRLQGTLSENLRRRRQHFWPAIDPVEV